MTKRTLAYTRYFKVQVQGCDTSSSKSFKTAARHHAGGAVSTRTPSFVSWTRQGILLLAWGQLRLETLGTSTHSSICLMMLGFSDGTPLLECRPLPTMTLSCRPFRLSTSQKAGLASAPFQHHAKFIRTFLGPLDGLFPAQSVHVYRVGLKVS